GVLRAGFAPNGDVFVVTADEALRMVDLDTGVVSTIRDDVTDAILWDDKHLMSVDSNGWAYLIDEQGLAEPFGCLLDECLKERPYPLLPEEGATDSWRLEVIRWNWMRSGFPTRLRLARIDGGLVTVEVPDKAYFGDIGEGRNWTRRVTTWSADLHRESECRPGGHTWVRMGSNALFVDSGLDDGAATYSSFGQPRAIPCKIPFIETSMSRVVYGDSKLAVEISYSPSDWTLSDYAYDTVRVGLLEGETFIPDASWPPAWRPPAVRHTEADVHGDRFLLYSRPVSGAEYYAPGGIRVWNFRPDSQVRSVVPGVVSAPPLVNWPDSELGTRWSYEEPTGDPLAPGLPCPTALEGIEGPALVMSRPVETEILDGIRSKAPEMPIYVVVGHPEDPVPKGTQRLFGLIRHSFQLHAALVHHGFVTWRGRKDNAAEVAAAVKAGKLGNYVEDATALKAELDRHLTKYEEAQDSATRWTAKVLVERAFELGDWEAARAGANEWVGDRDEPWARKYLDDLDQIGKPMSLDLLQQPPAANKVVVVSLKPGRLNTDQYPKLVALDDWSKNQADVELVVVGPGGLK
ncbi:MAG: hypothetical protein HN348_30480, partial [Proteobacteria bacterium]|nr:hypothetical protein [Pseudomonadota bacterium]